MRSCYKAAPSEPFGLLAMPARGRIEGLVGVEGLLTGAVGLEEGGAGEGL